MKTQKQIKISNINEKLKEFEPLIGYIASKVFSRIPKSSILEYCDLYQAGILGALKAIRKYDSKHGANLTTFVSLKSKYAMLDELRNSDPLTKTHRRSVNAGTADNIYFDSLQDFENERDDDNYNAELKLLNGCDLDPVFDQVLEQELQELCAGKFDDDRQLTYLRIKTGLPLKVIGKVVNLSEARVSQIVSEVMKRAKPLIINE